MTEPNSPGMPRWVKISAVVAGVLILLFLVLRLSGMGGEHGPGRHFSSHPAAVGAPHTDGLAG